jgi:heat shock protein HtpX
MSIDWGLKIRELFVYGVLLVLYAVAMLILYEITGSIILVTVLAGGLLFIQYFFSDRLVLWSTGACIVSEGEAPRLHMLVESLVRKMGLPKPKIAILRNDVPNAFATGRNYRNSVVCVTTGLLDRLNEQEVLGVLAHELSHVKHRDMFVVTFASFIVSVVSYAIYFLLALVSRDDRDNSGYGSSMLAYYVSMILSNTLGVLLVNTVSRYREYGADRGSADVTGHPEWLESALLRISDSRYSPEGARALVSARALCISPLDNALLELFSTHPTIERRIAKLEQIKSEMRGSSVKGSWDRR